MIEAAELRRTFNGKRAVDGITFAVDQGEVFGFLGPNGAGKTTTVSMFIGQLLPTSGSGRVAGHDIVRERDQIKPDIGVVFEDHALYERMSGKANLEFFCALHRVPNRRASELLEMVGLKDRGKDAVKKYSQGMKQRLAIARALVNSPKVLFMDEPTRGLDPGAARAIRQMITDLRNAGSTVFLTTHYMEEADQLCDRVAFINEGKLVAVDSPRALKLKYGRRQIRVVQQDGTEVIANLDNAEDAHRLELLLGGGQVLTIHSQEATLEDVYVQLTGRGLV
jgi:ABC-2 type transport system ATP-binding protein